MKYTIEFTHSAADQLSDVPKTDQRKIAKRIDKLAENPFPSGCTKLAGENNLYRVRQGDYRILYSVEGKKLIVLIVKIRHRRDVYL